MTDSLLSDIGANLYVVMEIMGYLIFTFLGSILKEIYNTNSIDDYEFQAHRVISSTVVGSITSGVIQSVYLQDYSYSLMAFASFTLGLMGFEIFKNLCSIKKTKKMLEDFLKITKLLSKFPDPTSYTEKDDDEEETENSLNMNFYGASPIIKIHTTRKTNNNDEVDD